MPEPIVYTEDYRGPRFVYGMVNRPPMYGTVPDGRIVGADNPDAQPDPRVRHGTVSYPRRLTAREVYAFELLPIDEDISEYAEMSLSDVWCLLLIMETPGNCPNCNGERESDGNSGATCHFCGMTMTVSRA